MGFRLVQTAITLNDVDRHNSLYFVFFFTEFDRFSGRLHHIDWRYTYNVHKILSPSSSLLLLAKTIAHPAARSLCASWASCVIYWQPLYIKCFLPSGQWLYIAGSTNCISITWCIYIDICRPVTDWLVLVWPRQYSLQSVVWHWQLYQSVVCQCDV